MNHYHVCVYAICKNEAKFVPGWIESMREADSIVVLDTGSTDETVCLLEEGGAKVTREIISPWRFDTARNRSLELVPEEADICVCTDSPSRLARPARSGVEARNRPGNLPLRLEFQRGRQ
jgi:glycosyltransferase involved in cell wall biosynthesis